MYLDNLSTLRMAIHDHPNFSSESLSQCDTSWFHNQLKLLLVKCPFYRFIILIFYFVCSGITTTNRVNSKHYFRPNLLISLHKECLLDASANKVLYVKFTFFSSFMRDTFLVQVYPDLSFFSFVNIFRSHFDVFVVRCTVF